MDLETLLTSIETIFETYSFAKEVILIIFGAVFGGICTVIINNGAMRKQCRFDMQYKILSEEAENVSELYRKVEALEIKISFGDKETAPYAEDISEIETRLLKLNERLREKRKFVRKYMKATTVEASAQYVSDFLNIFYTFGEGGLTDMRLTSKLSVDKIEKLRSLETHIRQLGNEMTDSMEELISPGIISKFKRKARKPLMFLEECNAIRMVAKKKK